MIKLLLHLNIVPLLPLSLPPFPVPFVNPFINTNYQLPNPPSNSTSFIIDVSVYTYVYIYISPLFIIQNIIEYLRLYLYLYSYIHTYIYLHIYINTQPHIYISINQFNFLNRNNPSHLLSSHTIFLKTDR